MTKDPQHTICVKGWVIKDNKVLFAKRSMKEAHAGGDWVVPGGKIEMEIEDDIAEKTVAREVLEEVGIVIKPNPKMFYTNAFIKKTGEHVVNFSFICEWESGEAIASEDTDEVKWIDIDKLIEFKDLPKYLSVERDRFLNNYVERINLRSGLSVTSSEK